MVETFRNKYSDAEIVSSPVKNGGLPHDVICSINLAYDTNEVICSLVKVIDLHFSVKDLMDAVPEGFIESCISYLSDLSFYNYGHLESLQRDVKKAVTDV